MGWGISPLACCDISKSHELKQFRVKGLGYMSLGFRLPNFPISQIVLAHLGWGLLGNLEIGKYVPVPISQFPNFPNRAEPDGLRSFGKLGNLYLQPFPNFPKKISAHLAQHDLGNWEIGKWVQVHTSQFPKRSQPIWLSTIWEIWKLGNGYRYILPNFPISQKTPARWASTTIWEIGKSGSLNPKLM